MSIYHGNNCLSLCSISYITTSIFHSAADRSTIFGKDVGGSCVFSQQNKYAGQCRDQYGWKDLYFAYFVFICCCAFTFFVASIFRTTGIAQFTHDGHASACCIPKGFEDSIHRFSFAQKGVCLDPPRGRLTVAHPVARAHNGLDRRK